MLDKTMLVMRVYNIASQYNINQATVHKIINSYINYCKDLLRNGIKVNIFGLCSLVPDYESCSLNNTLAYDCKVLADSIGLPSNTVFVIINEYLTSIEEEVLDGKTATIRGLVTFKPIEKENSGVVHSSISLSFRNSLLSDDLKVKSVRVHTSKLLKYKISRCSYDRQNA